MDAQPSGLTGTDLMPYDYRRWNGTVWPDALVDQYNAELRRIKARHEAGMNTDHLVNGLYNLAHIFDHVK